MKNTTVEKVVGNFNRQILFAILTSLAVSGCSKSSLTNISSSAALPSGFAMLGPLKGATVLAYAVLPNGNLASTALCPPATTDSSGYYSFNLKGVTLPAGPVAIQATGGSYTEEGSGTVMYLGSNSLTSLLPDPSVNPTLSVTIGPLTQIAFLNFQDKAQSGLPNGKTLKDIGNDANYTVSQAFGIPDIVGTTPENPFGKISNSTNGQYALALAAFSKAAATSGVDSYALASAYAANLNTSGNMTGSTITVTDLRGNTTNVSPPSMAALNGIVSGIGNGAITLAGVTPPSSFTELTMTSTPQNSAPANYTSGSLTANTSTSPTKSSKTRGAAISFDISGYGTTAVAGSPLSLIITALDVNGNVATGYNGTIHFTSTDTSASLPSDYTFTSGDAGVHISTVTLSGLGTQTITVRDSSSNSIQSANAVLSVQDASALRTADRSFSVINASSSSIAADGISTSIITVTLFDSHMNPVSGKIVTLSSDRSSIDTISAASGLSDTNGVVTFTVKSSTNGTSTYSAFDVSDNISITSTTTVAYFTPIVPSASQSTVTASPSSVVANGSSASTISVTLLDSGNNPASGKTVTLASSREADSISNASGTSNNSGLVTFSVRSSTLGTSTYTAVDTTDGFTIASTATVSFVAGPLNDSNSTVTSTSSSVTANGSAIATITVTLKDTTNNSVSGKTVTLNSSRNSQDSTDTISPVSGVSNSSGVVTFSVRSTTAGTSTYTATIDGTDLTSTASVTFNAGTASALAFTTQPSGGTGGSTMTGFAVSIVDAYNNIVASASDSIRLTIGTNAGSGTLSGTTVVATASGLATFANVIIDKAGSGYTLVAKGSTYSSSSGITSSPFVISIGSPSQMSISGGTSTTLSTCSPAYSIGLQDAGGNTATNSGSSIDINISSSGSAALYSNSICTTSATTVTLENNSSTSASFYLKDSAVETVTISASNVNYSPSTVTKVVQITSGDNTGISTILAGTYGSAGLVNATGLSAKFNAPRAVAADSSGNVFVADENNHVIRKVTQAGVVTTLAGSGTSGFADGTGAAAKFNYPRGLAVDNTGNIFVADANNHRIRKITPDGVVTTLAGSSTFGYNNGTGSTAQFTFPQGLAIDSSGNFVVTDLHSVRRMTSAGVVTLLAGQGNYGSTDGSGANAMFKGPSGPAFDSSGNVYIADYNNFLIRKITPAGVVTTIAGSTSQGSTDGTGLNARFYYPSGIVINSSGTMYISDNYNQTIRKLTFTGAGGAAVVTTLAGVATQSGSNTGTGTAARFSNPIGLAIDNSGNLYTAENAGHVIRKIQ